ncbi:iron-containing alcohol dehydrogenase [Rhodobacteraceae bacterium HSP-20]|uniref:Iron-containing alcohol dehydrogenase n=1 Tax=Paragemmobacter amnigenus TaxID=2852097 RepID=A0ABS6J5Q7_9RHOB|nr:iron-containing alcohol dehydrogenase [Rhodobacter amnigenus]MBU9697710.1 iron-containing alcohol dehydrogenase [Rhodobacter amnigenus]MBV4388937.1 iron-containing alcohol dehydrogenase [Rhodobacter amnigenus]
MPPFAIAMPQRILFGRGEAKKAPALLAPFGPRGLIVHGANPARAQWLRDALHAAGIETLALACASEPTLPMLEAALTAARPFAPLWVAGLGGGAALDLGKALAALIPAPTHPLDHLEVVGKGLPLAAPPLPFIALPTTAGTGAEATKNAVIGLPDHGRKVSLRDDRMLARLAIVDPALTDHTPRATTLASGLDAITQVIEPYVSSKATPFTDALTAPAIPQGLQALHRLMENEDPDARDALAHVSLTGGIALANAGLGAVHGLAGVIGGLTPAPHGAICGALLAPVLRLNRAHATGETARRLDTVFHHIAQTLGGRPEDAPETLATWARNAGLPGLTAQGLPASLHDETAQAALASSSMKGNPVQLTAQDLRAALEAAA